MKNTMTYRQTAWCLSAVLLALSLLTVSCNSTLERLDDSQTSEGSQQGTALGQVAFSAYLKRPATRAGVAGELTTTNLRDADKGFGVIAYHTDGDLYNPTFKPNFMYNQQVLYNSTENVWEYTPLKYWPNSTAANGGEENEYLTFFAYAPWAEVTPSTGKVTGDDANGIVSLTRNTLAGDPKVRYKASLTPAECVDFCWAQPLADQTRPASVSDKVDLTFNHALASLNVMVDAYVDGTDAINTPAAETRVWIRSITFEGFTTHGSFNLNSTTADWMEPYSDTPIGNSSITVYDGRADGLEGKSASTNEQPLGLNDWVTQQYAYGTALDAAETAFNDAGHSGKLGVYNDLRNLFGSETATDPIYVIPTDRPLRVTIAYDIETQAANLPGYLADGKTHGVSVTNVITATIQKAGGGNLTLSAGKNYTVRLHLGISSVQCAAAVTDWGATADPHDLEVEMEDLPISQMMLNVYVNPWSYQDEVLLSVPMTDLTDLGTYFKAARSGDDDISGRYLGLNVDAAGNIEGLEGTEYDGVPVGRIAYISTDGTDVDASRTGSRILVLALESDFGTDLHPWSTTSGLQGYTDILALNGKTFTSNHSSADFPAGKAANDYNSTKGITLGGATGWFLPSKQQMMLVGCNDGSAVGQASLMGLGNGTFWCATEQDAATARCYVDGRWQVDSKTTGHKLRPMFAY